MARYNRFVKKLSLAAAALVMAACSKNIQNADAVKQGILDYLKERSPQMGLNMDAMDVTVGSVSFDKDQARATVSFVPKGAPGSGGMSMAYVLDRKGDKWVVKGRQAGPGMTHGTEGQLPPGHPPTGNGTEGALPPGHPPTGTPQ
jgi:hypothetical protein